MISTFHPHVGFLPDLCLMAARMDKLNLAELKAPHNYSRKTFIKYPKMNSQIMHP